MSVSVPQFALLNYPPTAFLIYLWVRYGLAVKNYKRLKREQRYSRPETEPDTWPPKPRGQ